ncbi:hypothetical protein CERZMDRAFT_82115 [Cercospora zeae-maydis SCOH1-5]|uniref:Uncharacterized protein n=1 Tax=Cercospora zeae-maydis SCOH1-5 TaxID=717836 RepID=A0A6A6FRP8_9PEZI|nr:hypothetical protein CERZMDRAFT_82115 [Cercospora zeae-maydis SCOH1-5]
MDSWRRNSIRARAIVQTPCPEFGCSPAILPRIQRASAEREVSTQQTIDSLDVSLYLPSSALQGPTCGVHRISAALVRAPRAGVSDYHMLGKSACTSSFPSLQESCLAGFDQHPSTGGGQNPSRAAYSYRASMSAATALTRQHA